MGEEGQEIKILDCDKIWYPYLVGVEWRNQKYPYCEDSNQGVIKLGLVTILVIGMFCIRAAAFFEQKEYSLCHFRRIMQ